MYFKPLLLPLLAQVALTFIVMVNMYRKRVSEMKIKRIHPQRIKTRYKSKALLTDSASAADNYSNLFELPALFYLAILLTLTLMVQDSILVVLAWLFVVSRYLHSFIHVSYNNVMHRFSVFIFGSFVILAYWVRLGWIILLA
ncbi:MAG: MAPEG family protein [Lysobacterales bacterium]